MNTDNNTHEYYIRLKESESRMNTHEVRVSLETAKMLQKAGFDWECEYAFTPTTEMGDKAYRYNQGKSHNYNNKEDYPFEIYSAPSLDVAQRWLREVKSFMVETIFITDEYGVIYQANLYEVISENSAGRVGELISVVKGQSELKRTYEEAQEAGIQKCLTILLEEKK